MNIRLHRSLLLGTAIYLGTTTAFAVECPEGTENSEACAELKAAEEQTKAAAARLEAMATAGPKEKQARAIIDKFLDNMTPPTQDLGRLQLNQAYTMTEDGEHYETTFTEAAWIVEDTRIDFGPLTFRIQPQDDGLSNVNLRVGDSITIREDQDVVAKLLIGEQNSQGLWDAKLENFSKADWKISKLELVVPEEPVSMALDSLHVGQVLNRAEDDTWNTDGNMKLTNLKIQAEGNTVNLGHIAGQLSMAGRHYQKFLTLSQEFKSLAEQDMDESEAAKKITDFMGEIYALFSRFDSSMVISDLLVGSPEQPMGQVERLAINTSFNEGDSSGSRFGYEIEMTGLQTQAPFIPPKLLPRNARLGLEVINIPPKMFSRLMEAAIASEEMSPAEKEAYMNQQMLGMIMSSDLGVKIKDAFIAAEDARLDLNLRAGVDTESAMGGTGELQVRIEGMQNVIDAAGAAAQEEGAAQAIGMLMMFSNRTEEGGKVIDSYDLKFTKEGQLFLNGKDMSPMLMGGGAPPDQAPQ